MTPLTDEVRYQRLLEYHNGFGLQYPHPPNTRAPICMLNEKFDDQRRFIKQDYEAVIKDLQVKTRAETLDWNFRGGRPIVTLDWSDQDKIELIFDCLVKMQLNFQLATKAMPQFGACQKDSEFTMSMIEARMALNLKTGMQDLPRAIFASVWKDTGAVDMWNWKTSEGLQTCLNVRRYLGLPAQNMDDPNNFRTWASYNKFDDWAKEKIVLWS